jgi:HD-like signal output (HDOD) protein
MTTTATTTSKETLLKKLENLDSMPSLPVTLVPLLRYLEQPVDGLDMQQVVDLISQDKSLTAQCLHLANSPLFGHWKEVGNVRAAVMTLGLQRMRDIAVSCSVLSLVPKGKTAVDPIVFWEHSLGCALVSRQFAVKIKYPSPDKAYLAGLLHDIGIVAHIWVLGKDYQAILESACSQHIPLHEAEMEAFGFTHCATGKALAERWHLPPDLVTTVGCHHDIASCTQHRDLVAVVALSDLLCRMGGLGYGYSEEREVDLLEEPGFAILQQECPELRTFDWARFTFELEGYMEEVHRLVSLVYRPS